MTVDNSIRQISKDSAYEQGDSPPRRSIFKHPALPGEQETDKSNDRQANEKRVVAVADAEGGTRILPIDEIEESRHDRVRQLSPIIR